MKGIHFGALDPAVDSDDVMQDDASGMISLDALDRQDASKANGRTADHSHHHLMMTVDQAEGLAALDQRRLARQLTVPTDNANVCDWLIIIGEPITLFGEGPYQRRERLRLILADPAKDSQRRLRVALEKLKKERQDGAIVEDSDEFYVPGSEALAEARKAIAAFSIARAKERLAAEVRFRSQSVAQVKEERLIKYERWRGYRLEASQVGCERPLSCGAFSADGQLYATGGFGGSLKVWQRDGARLAANLAGHPTRTSCVRFYPGVGSSLSLASSADDGDIALWSLANPAEPIGWLQGHTSRAARFAFHPSGRFLGSASFDYSWRLWDLEAQTELQLQEGHTRPVYCLDFHPDGSLVATGGLDSFGRIWDLRLGKCIWTLQGHIKGILGVCFAPSIGYELATASEDGTVRLWDLRALKPAYSLPAHPSTVSEVVWTSDSDGLLTAAFDGSARLWSRHGWKLLGDFQGHSGKVMAVDMTRDGLIATAGYDRTFKFWSVK